MFREVDTNVKKEREGRGKADVDNELRVDFRFESGLERGVGSGFGSVFERRLESRYRSRGERGIGAGVGVEDGSRCSRRRR